MLKQADICFGQKLSVNDHREYWVTSDLHFFHKNIMKYNSDTRPWTDVVEMNAALIKHWNERVAESDVVFHLGDFSFGNVHQTMAIIEKLRGNIMFIQGNHCYGVFKKIPEFTTHHYMEVKLDGKKVCLFHYPIASWNQQGRGSVHLHGHSHGKYEAPGKLLDVGWDNVGQMLRLDIAVGIADQFGVFTSDGHTVSEEGTGQ